MIRFVCAATAALMVCLCSPSRADEGMWTFHGFPAREGQRRAQDPASTRRGSTACASPPCACRIAPPRSFRRRPDPHEHHCVEPASPSTPRRRRAWWRWLPREDARRREALPDAGGGRAGRHGRHHRARSRRPRGQGRDRRERRAQEHAHANSRATARSTTSQKCQSVTLYKGGQYWLYKYKRYNDVRLVFAPENAHRGVRRRPGQLPVPALVPRHGLLRAYEDGKPAKTPRLPEDRLRGPRGERAGVRVRPSRLDGSPADGRAAQAAARLLDLPQWLLRNSELRGRSSSSAGRARRTSASSRTCSTASRTASRCAASSSTRCTTTRCWRARPPSRPRCRS